VDPIKAYDRWVVKFNPTYVGQDIDASRLSMIALYSLSAVQSAADECAISAILATTSPATSCLSFPFYYDFGREIRKLKTRYLAGGVPRAEAELRIAKWVGRGYLESVLREILCSVYTICPPALGFVALGQTSRDWTGMTANPLTGDVYACTPGEIYMRALGVGDFVALGQAPAVGDWWGMCSTPGGDVYACAWDGDIYLQSGGVGDFVALDQETLTWYGMAVNPVNGDVYACVIGGDIYVAAGGVLPFVGLGRTDDLYWVGMAGAPNGDIYASTYYPGEVYLRAGGVGDFVALGQADRVWGGMCADPDGNVYVAESAPVGDLYCRALGVGDFAPLGQAPGFWAAMAAAANGDVYAAMSSGDIYMRSHSA
jgi:hypothetical protein